MLLHLHKCLQSLAHVVAEMVAVTRDIGQKSLMPHNGHLHFLLVILVGVTLSLELAEEFNESGDNDGGEGVLLGQHSLEEEPRSDSVRHLGQFHTGSSSVKRVDGALTKDASEDNSLTGSRIFSQREQESLEEGSSLEDGLLDSVVQVDV